MPDVSAARKLVDESFTDSIPGSAVICCSATSDPVAKVTKAYFAKLVEKKKAFIEQPYQIEKKDTYGKIAMKVRNVDTADLRKYPLVPGTTIVLKIKKKVKELSFERINRALIGETLWIVVETQGLEDQQLQIEVLGSNNTTFISPNSAACLLQSGKETDKLMATIGQ